MFILELTLLFNKCVSFQINKKYVINVWQSWSRDIAGLLPVTLSFVQNVLYKSFTKQFIEKENPCTRKN